MALLGFQEWKSKKVESGECRQTIRARRVHPVKVGDRLIFARGVRTKNYRKIGEAVCTETFELSLQVTKDGKTALWSYPDATDMEEVARLDGFADLKGMTEWFLTNHPGTAGAGLAWFDVIRW